MLNPTEALEITADLYRVDIDDRIVISGNFTGGSISELLLPLGATGARFFTNAIDTKTVGLDLNVNYRVPLDTMGDLRLSAAYNTTDNDILRVADTPAPLAGLEQVLFDQIERRRVECGQPRNNYRLAGAWNRRELSANVRAARYGQSCIVNRAVADQNYEPEWLFDAEVSYRLNKAVLGFGVQNLFDAFPDENLPENANLGIFPYPSHSPFGMNGRFLYQPDLLHVLALAVRNQVSICLVFVHDITRLMSARARVEPALRRGPTWRRRSRAPRRGDHVERANQGATLSHSSRRSMTGLSVDTLRGWERRYDAVAPGRNDRGRLYSDADVARLKQLGELVKRGHAIGTIAGLAEADLAGLLKRADALTDPAEAAPVARLDLLERALERYDLDAIEATLNRYAASTYPRVIPSSRSSSRCSRRSVDVGKLETLRPAQEHLVSAIVRSVIGGLLRATMRPNASPKIVFATPAGERHELGLLSAALLTASAGYGVVYLGPDLPAADIAHAAAAAGARVVIVSLTTPGAVTRGEMRTLARIGQAGVELWVGGPEAQSLLSTATGSRLRHIDRLDNVVPILSRDVS